MSTAREAYRDYYDATGDPDLHIPRYQWTIDTFMPGVAGKKILESQAKATRPGRPPGSGQHAASTSGP